MLEQEDQKDWEKWIPQVLFDYHSTQHSSTGLTPFQLHIGRQPRSPFATLTLPLEKVKEQTVKQYMTSYERNIKAQQAIARENLKGSMEDRKRYYDQHLHHHSYSKGDLVMCRNYQCKKGLKPKLMRERWTGPWEIDQLRGPVNYRITRQRGRKRLRMLIHHDRIKPYFTRPANLHQQDESGVNEVEMADLSTVSPESHRGVTDSETKGMGADGSVQAELPEAEGFSDADSDMDDGPDEALAPATPDRRVAIPEVVGLEPGVGRLDPGQGVQPMLDLEPVPYVSRSGRQCNKTRRLVEDPHFGQ